jgi:hypothetical protein
MEFAFLLGHLFLSLNMSAAEFVSLFVIKLKTTVSIFVKMRRANLLLVVLQDCIQTPGRYRLQGYKGAATVVLPSLCTVMESLS